MVKRAIFKNFYILTTTNNKIIITDHENTPYFIILLLIIVFTGILNQLSIFWTCFIFIIVLIMSIPLTKIIIDSKSIKKSYFFFKKEFFKYFEYSNSENIEILFEEAESQVGDSGFRDRGYIIYLTFKNSSEKIFIFQVDTLEDGDNLKDAIKNLKSVNFKIKPL